jgi:DNA-binding transcriptional regulator YiaG
MFIIVLLLIGQALSTTSLPAKAALTVDELAALARVRALAESGAARAFREAAGLSLGEVAGPVGTDKGTLSRWERGQQRPCGAAALRWLEVLVRLGAR